MRVNWNYISLKLPKKFEILCNNGKDFEFTVEYITNSLNSGRFPTINDLMNLSNILELLITQTMSLAKEGEQDKEEINEIERKFKAIRIEVARFREDLRNSQIRENISSLGASIRDFKLFYDSVLVPSIYEALDIAEYNIIRGFSMSVKRRIGIVPSKKEEKEFEKEIKGES